MMEERKLRKKKEKAINERNYEHIYKYCEELGEEYSKAEEYQEALEEYKEAENAAKELGNKLYIATANRKIGETLCNLSEFERALTHLKIHLNLAREMCNPVEEQRALATIGRTYFIKADSIPNEDDDKKKCLELSRKYNLKSLNVCERLSPSNNLSPKELSQMKSRLFWNLGLTYDSEGDICSAVEHIEKAIHIFKQFELMEDLCKCYIVQGSLFLKHGDISKAILNCDEALKISDRLENRILFSCEILSLKADVLIKLSDFTGAKQCLIKAYKLKTSDREIEKKLKIIVMICKAEKKLLEVTENDYSSRKCLNETLGDYFVELENFKKAIECYCKMLECSETLGLTGKDLIPAYNSLAETYKDDGQYDMALKYYERQFTVEKDHPVEAYKTLLNIIEVLELQKVNFDIIMEKYQQALSLAKKTGDLRIEADVLRNKIDSEKKYNREDLADETQKELDVVLCCIPEEDNEIISNASDEESQFDFDLEELSDLNTDTEEKSPNRENHPRRKITKSFIVRRNEKGETPLHVASAKGNLQLIKSLLKQGHPVNIPDAAGWSPLHEACNHGQIEAARILIDAGANVNDRGGPNCDGITPLHDAASNGQLEIIDMLLDNGASPLARNNEGETALDCLIACKKRVESEEGELDSIKLAHFHSVKSRLEECLSKVSYNDKRAEPVPKIAISKSQTRQKESNFSQKWPSSIERDRKHHNLDAFASAFGSSAIEYKDTIQALRHRNKKDYHPKLNENCKKSKLPALLNSEEVGDDWLENDLEISKRPAKRRCEEFSEQQQIKKVKSKPITSKGSSSYQKKTPTTSEQVRWDNSFDDFDLNELDFAISPQLSPTHVSTEVLEDDVILERTHNVTNQRKITESKGQKSHQSVGFKRFDPPCHSTQQAAFASNSVYHNNSIESSITQQVASSSTLAATNQSIKVRVEGKLFLVPVPIDHSKLNMKWLVSESSRRYQNFEGVSPVLSLSTEDGAILDENDPISIVMGKNEIHATVLSWNLPPLVDQYEKACASSNIVADEYLRIQLDMCQASAHFEIQDVCVQLPILTPALKAISHYQNLQRICLREVFLGDSGFKLLVDTITKLTQLRCFDVSSNNITVEGLSYFSLVLSKNVPLQNLEELNLSFNPLGDDSIHHLISITRYFINLRVFIVKSIGITSQALYEAANFNLEFVEYLDISNNFVEREGSAKFLSALDSNKIKYLNLSRTGGSEVLRECLLFLDRGYLDMLNTLKLADLNIDNNDVGQLIQSLKKADQIATLDLSCNKKLTLDSHIFLSELSNLKELNLSGCDVLTESNKLILPFCNVALSSEFNENTFKDAPYGLLVN